MANESTLRERIEGRRVLVIGGAGTIGSSFIKAMLPYRPGGLYVVDISENGLTELTRDLRSTHGLKVPVEYKTYPVNFGGPVFEKILRMEGPFDIVANFAAHKHVRSEKDHYSIEAMIENNVLRAKRLLDLLLEHPPAHFFCVSTDKAANPVNVMGASKKLMEEVILAYSRHIPITTARFANVAFSNGSLPAGFLERLMKRQPLSAPMDVRRYFVSPGESGQICLLACILGNPGEIFFPKLDPRHDMKDFASIGTALLQINGFEPDYCQSDEEARDKAKLLDATSTRYPVHYFTSDTSGEKPYEEFYVESEELDTGRFASLGVIKNALRRDVGEIEEMFSALNALFQNGGATKAGIVKLMRRFVPNFQHIETGKGLDDKM